MSHHFDTPTAKEDPRINVCDFYLFRGRPGTTVMAMTVNPIVLEVPSHLIGQGLVHSWATASLCGHAPEVQVSRWGLALITHLFLSDPALKDIKEEYNRAMPADDVERFCPFWRTLHER